MTESNGMRIALAAPSGVGKTSILTALLDEANDVLSGTPVGVEAVGTTRKRLNQLKNQLRGHLKAGEFNTKGLGGTQDVAEYSLAITAAGASERFGLHFMDYPGGLLEERSGEKWARVSAWFQGAEILLLPIDATLLMEATTGRQKSIAEQLLNVAEVESTAIETWAKRRTAAGLEAGVLILAPVKCETYLPDNGGFQDRAQELQTRVREAYEDLVQKVHKEAPGTRTFYCPIDTIGCVEVLSVDWSPRAEEPRAGARYRVRGEGKLQRKGSDDLFVLLVRQLLAAAKDDQQTRVDEAAAAATRAVTKAEKDYGTPKNFLMWISRKRKKLREVAGDRREAAERELASLVELQNTLVTVGKRELSGRASQLGG